MEGVLNISVFDKRVKLCYNICIISNSGLSRPGLTSLTYFKLAKNMNRLLKFIGLTAVLVVFCVLTGVSTANAASAPILYVTKTKSQININEKVTIHALSVSQEQGGEAPDYINFYIDKEKTATVSCANKHYCGMTYWVVDKSKGNKWHKFTVTANYKGKFNSKIVYVFVTNKVVGENPKAPEPTTPVAPAGDQVPTYSQIITSNHQPKVGETFSATIYPSEKGGVNLNKIDVMLDGKVVKTCALNNSIASCGTTFGPFVAGDVGEHKYEFLMTGVNGKTSQPWGKFWVNAAPQAVEDYPEYEKVVTSGDTITVGETFKATVYAKAGKSMYKVEGFIDNVLMNTGSNCTDIGGCADVMMSLGPAAVNQIGDHTYKFIVSSKSGKSLVINGKFQVVAVPEKDTKAPEISISSTKDTLQLNESATVTAIASDNKAVSKIQILVFGGVVKECAGVNTCSYQIGPITNNTYVTKYSYSAYAYDAAGNNMFTGNKYITVELVKPVPTVEPTISVEASKSKINTTDTVVFKGNVNQGTKKLTKLQILVNQTLAKECAEAVCEYTGGPFPTYVGKTVNYAATAYFSDGTWKTTGYNFIPVTNVPKISISPVPTIPDHKSLINFTAVAEQGNKTLKTVDVVVNDKIVKTCDTPVCIYIGGPYNTKDASGRGYGPITYAANACFTDGTCITTWNKNLAILTTNNPV